MNSSKPYIIRALHEWISDNDCTPLVLVSSEHEEVQIPSGIAKDGKVVLNISYGATQNLQLIEEGIMFDARFSGVSQNIFVPMESVLAIYARENGQGMMFGEQDETPPDPDPGKSTTDKPAVPAQVKRPNLKIVK